MGLNCDEKLQKLWESLKFFNTFWEAQAILICDNWTGTARDTALQNTLYKQRLPMGFNVKMSSGGAAAPAFATVLFIMSALYCPCACALLSLRSIVPAL
uniref:Transposase n=1 Tax=Romanomermis culicivorax TaxID=13658 RepID=A0A915JLI4_ROMCU